MKIRRAGVIASSALLGGCLAVYGFDDYDTARPLVDGEAGIGAAAGLPFALVRPSPLVLHRGGEGSVVIALTRNGATSAIPLGADPPNGITIAPATIAADASEATLFVTVSPTASIGAAPVTIHAGAATTTLDLTVAGATLDPSFGDGGIVVGTVGESFIGLAVDTTDRFAVSVRTAPNAWLVHRGDAHGAFTTLERDELGTKALVGVTAVGATTILSSATPEDPFTQLTGYRNGIPRWEISVEPGSLDVPQVLPFSASFARLVTTEAHVADDEGIYSRVLDVLDGGVTENGTELFDDATATMAAVADGTDRAVVCTTTAHGDSGEITIAAIRADGTLDPGFADAGKIAVTGADGVELSCVDVVAVGEHFVVLAFADAHVGASPVLFSLSTSGVRDPVFGDGGLLDLGPDVTASGLVVDARGRVLVAEAAHDAARVVAFGADGRPELTFGDATGKLAIPLAGVAAARDVRLLSDGRILVGGSLVGPSGERWFVAAFLP